MPLSNTPHIPQIGLGYCLPACAQMALAQLGITLTQEAIAQLLGTHRGIGTPFSRILRLREPDGFGPADELACFTENGRARKPLTAVSPHFPTNHHTPLTHAEPTQDFTRNAPQYNGLCPCADRNTTGAVEGRP